MKTLITKLFTALIFIVAVSTSGLSQNQVYWREGFEPNSIPACNLTTVAPTASGGNYFDGNAGTWYGHNVYRTTGTGCPSGNNHLRFRNISGVPVGDSGYVVTPIVNGGIQELHFSRARANRSHTIWVTDDTLATTTNWTPILFTKSSAATVTCVDTTLIIASPTAKRLKISARPGTDTDIDSIWMTSYYKINENYIKGSVFLDINSNGVKDGSDTYFPTIVTSSKSYFARSTLSLKGLFKNKVDSGTYQTSILNRPYYNCVPLFKISTFDSTGQTDSVNFALQPIPNKNDLRVGLFSPSLARLGRPVDYYLGYANIGTTTQNAQVKFLKDSRVTFLSSQPNYTSVSGDTLIWNYPNLQPDSFGLIKIHCKIATPPVAFINDTLLLNAYVAPSTNDETPINNHQLLKQRIIGAYDPNDKQEVHDGNYSLTDLANKESLLYTIRFQNIGNDTAFTVVVKDTLDGKLDINSLQMVSSSHNYKLDIVDNKYLTWTFDNILLVDSNHNEPASHAYIAYRINPKATVVSGDIINNSASIYFDYNPPVLTNVQKTVIGNTSLPVKLQSFTGKLNSNKTVALKWQSATEINMDKYIVEKSVDASKYYVLSNVAAQNKTNAIYQFTDEQVSKGSNYYRLQMIENNGKYSYSNIVVVLLENNSSITVFPNPAKDYINIESKGVKQVTVTDCFGRIVVQLNNITEHQTINTKEWSRGMYILNFDNGERIKIIKE